MKSYNQNPPTPSPMFTLCAKINKFSANELYPQT